MPVSTVLDGSDDSYYENGNIRGGSRMTPAEGAFYLNVPNLILVRNSDRPPLPYNERWRTKTTFEQYAISFRPLDRVLWSVVGSGGHGGLGELEPVLHLARNYPNISGIYLDDFIIDCQNRDGRLVGRPALDPKQLQAARDRLRTLRRPMEVWVTIYAHEVLPQHPHFCFAAKRESRLRAAAGRLPRPVRRVDALDLMKRQCDLALEWIKGKRIHEIIVLGNTGIDLGLPTAEFVRNWIAQVGHEPV